MPHWQFYALAFRFFKVTTAGIYFVLWWLHEYVKKEVAWQVKPQCSYSFCTKSWWRHQMEKFSVLLAICAGNSPVTGEFPAQRPVMWSFDVFFDLRLNKWLSKQSWAWWFETTSRPLWSHRNVIKLLSDINSLRPKQNFCHFPDNIFKCNSLNEKVWISIVISLKFFLRVRLTIFQHWFR